MKWCVLPLLPQRNLFAIFVVIIIPTSLRTKTEKMHSEDDKGVLSLTVSALRLPMAIGVVFIHISFSSVMVQGHFAIDRAQVPVYAIFEQLLCNQFVRIAVPFFFFVSGYFFFKEGNLTLRSYIAKLKRRAYTLLMPYMTWNMIYVLLYFVTQCFICSLTSGRNKLVVDYGLIDWLNVFWSLKDGMPICYPLWFVRDLMLVVVLSPLVYVLLQKLKVIALVVFALLFLYCPIDSEPALPLFGMFYFAFGAWFSLRRVDFTVAFSRHRWLLAVLYVILTLIDVLRWYNGVDGFYEIRELSLLVGLMMVIGFVAHYISRCGQVRVLAPAGCAFFLFAFHSMPLNLASKLWLTTLPVTDGCLILGVILLPLLLSAIGIGLYLLLQRYASPVARLLTGGR
ncbi:MAG: acyltransferase family protein [Muribaculaceae bacterium]